MSSNIENIDQIAINTIWRPASISEITAIEITLLLSHLCLHTSICLEYFCCHEVHLWSGKLDTR